MNRLLPQLVDTYRQLTGRMFNLILNVVAFLVAVCYATQGSLLRLQLLDVSQLRFIFPQKLLQLLSVALLCCPVEGTAHLWRLVSLEADPVSLLRIVQPVNFPRGRPMHLEQAEVEDPVLGEQGITSLPQDFEQRTLHGQGKLRKAHRVGDGVHDHALVLIIAGRGFLRLQLQEPLS